MTVFVEVYHGRRAVRRLALEIFPSYDRDRAIHQAVEEYHDRCCWMGLEWDSWNEVDFLGTALAGSNLVN